MRTTIVTTLAVLLMGLTMEARYVYAVPVTSGNGPGGFLPTGVSSDLTLWLRGDEGLSTTGSAVTAWADQSGHGQNVSQGDANKQPQQSTTLNSIPTVTFDGGGVTDPAINADFMTTTVGSVAATTIFIANSTNGFNGGCCNPIFSNSVGFLSSRYIGAGWQTPGDGNDFTNPVGSDFRVNGATGTAAAQNTPHVLTAERSGAAFNFTQFRLAQHSSLENRSWEGDMGEVAVFNRTLDGAETVLVDNYLSSKFAIALDVGGGAIDLYDGDLNGNGDYDYDLIGVLNDGTDSVGTGGNAGFGIEATGSLDSNDSVLAAHHSLTNSLVGSDIAAAGINRRWDRAWYVDERGDVDITMGFDFSDSGLTLPGGVSNFTLLFRENETFSFTDVGLAPTISDDLITFDLSGATLQTGIYTLGFFQRPIPEPSSLLLLGLGCCGLLVRRRRRAHGVVNCANRPRDKRNYL